MWARDAGAAAGDARAVHNAGSMKAATLEIEIARPQGAVHAVLEDVTTYEGYLDHFLSDWRRITRTRSGVGAAVRVRVKGVRRHDKMVVRVIKSSPRKVVQESKGGKDYRQRVRGTYELKERRNGSTRVRYTLEFLEGSLGDRLLWPAGRRRLVRGARTGLERLKEQLEA